MRVFQGRRSLTLAVTGEVVDRVGELLAADHSASIIRGDRIIRVTWARLEQWDIDGMGWSYEVSKGEHVGTHKIAKMAHDQPVSTRSCRICQFRSTR
jgi:hypothetical protein